MKVNYINFEKNPGIIEQCNFNDIGSISFFQWFTEFDLGGGVSSTVCIWRIKYKN